MTQRLTGVNHMVKRNLEFEREFGANVRYWREFRGLTLQDLASRMTDHGRPQGAGKLSTIERGVARSPAGGRDIEAIAAVLDVPVATLFLPLPMARVIIAWTQKGRSGALVELSRQLAESDGDRQ